MNLYGLTHAELVLHCMRELGPCTRAQVRDHCAKGGRPMWTTQISQALQALRKARVISVDRETGLWAVTPPP